DQSAERSRVPAENRGSDAEPLPRRRKHARDAAIVWFARRWTAWKTPNPMAAPAAERTPLTTLSLPREPGRLSPREKRTILQPIAGWPSLGCSTRRQKRGVRSR